MHTSLFVQTTCTVFRYVFLKLSLCVFFVLLPAKSIVSVHGEVLSSPWLATPTQYTATLKNDGIYQSNDTQNGENLKEMDKIKRWDRKIRSVGWSPVMFELKTQHGSTCTCSAKPCTSSVVIVFPPFANF